MGIQPFKKLKSEKYLQEVIDLYRAGLTYREIGDKLDMSHETARQIHRSAPVDKLTGQDLTGRVG